MSAFTEIMEYIQTFEKYGCKEYENGTKEYGHAPFIAPEAYNFCVFATLNEDDIVELERDLKREIPSQFRSFLMTDTNGLHLFHHFSLYGMENLTTEILMQLRRLLAYLSRTFTKNLKMQKTLIFS